MVAVVIVLFIRRRYVRAF